MITIEQQQKGVDLVKNLIEKSWEDNSFKKRLIRNPITTIQGFTGISFEMTRNKNLIVEDQTNKSIIFLNIPRNPNVEEIELSDEQLEQVSGGEFWATAATVGGCIALANEVYKFGKGVYDGYNAPPQN
jgi:hypothetical protein